jgi:hypothetical protein
MLQIKHIRSTTFLITFIRRNILLQLQGLNSLRKGSKIVLRRRNKLVPSHHLNAVSCVSMFDKVAQKATLTHLFLDWLCSEFGGVKFLWIEAIYSIVQAVLHLRNIEHSSTVFRKLQVLYSTEFIGCTTCRGEVQAKTVMKYMVQGTGI